MVGLFEIPATSRERNRGPRRKRLPKSRDRWSPPTSPHRNTHDRAPATRNRRSTAALGRWLTRDPIGYAGGINLYKYCGGQPCQQSDPTGELTHNECVGECRGLAIICAGLVSAETAGLGFL